MARDHSRARRAMARIRLSAKFRTRRPNSTHSILSRAQANKIVRLKRCIAKTRRARDKFDPEKRALAFHPRAALRPDKQRGKSDSDWSCALKFPRAAD